jgi:hypothetical protein
MLGEEYRRYRREVPAFLPRPGRSAVRTPAPDGAAIGLKGDKVTMR